MEDPGDELEDERLTEDHVATRRQLRDRPREGDAGDEHGQRDDEPGQGPRRADVEQLPLGGDRGADADERSQRPDAEGDGQEVGERGVEAIRPAGEVVAELVGEQDEEQRQREGQPRPEHERVAEQAEKQPGADEDLPERRDGEALGERGGEEPTEQRGGEECEAEQEGV